MADKIKSQKSGNAGVSFETRAVKLACDVQ
jgi:hypothetical protein